MNEEILNVLSTGELLDQLIEATNELIAMHKRHEDKAEIQRKLREIQLIQKHIVARRNEIREKID